MKGLKNVTVPSNKDDENKTPGSLDDIHYLILSEKRLISSDTERS